MQFQQAILSQLPHIMEIISEAQAYLRANNIPQWQDGYPNSEVIRADIEGGDSYVITDKQGQVVATAALKFGGDPNYMQIYEGTWKSSGDYGALHRIAICDSYKGQGVAGQIIDALIQICLERRIFSIRVDTHQENLSMQRMLKKHGFAYCGQIFLADGSPRIAFEKILQEK